MTAPTKTWKKLTRRLADDGNPLRRREDLIEGWLMPVAVVVFLALSPVVAIATGALVHADNAASRHVEASYRPVRGVLLQSAPGPEESDDGANAWLVSTPARWMAGGRPHRGYVPAPARTAAGSVVTVWLDRAGRVELPPLTSAQASDRVIVATVTALAALAMLLAGLPWLGRKVLDRRRLAGWEAGWLAVGPRWTRQT